MASRTFLIVGILLLLAFAPSGVRASGPASAQDGQCSYQGDWTSSEGVYTSTQGACAIVQLTVSARSAAWSIRADVRGLAGTFTVRDCFVYGGTAPYGDWSGCGEGSWCVSAAGVLRACQTITPQTPVGVCTEAAGVTVTCSYGPFGESMSSSYPTTRVCASISILQGSSILRTASTCLSP